MEHTAVAGQTDLDEPEPSYHQKLLSSVNKLSSQAKENKTSTRPRFVKSESFLTSATYLVEPPALGCCCL